MTQAAIDPIPRGRVGVAIPEDAYKVDVALLSQYQSYSAELLRLSLLGIAAVGFLLKDVALGGKPEQTHFLVRLLDNSWIVIVSICALGFAAACALAHRIFSAESFACMTLFLRCTDPAHPQALDNARAERERAQFHKQLTRAAWCLIGSAFFLGLAAISLVAAFVVVLAHA